MNINFTNCSVNKYNYYGGKNGGKICINYNDEDYMLKFPSDSNYSFSEYVSCRIIKSLGLNVQETILGEYIKNNEVKNVVACKDFVKEGFQLKQFAELKNSQIETSQSGYGTELKEILETIENQSILNIDELKNFFWEMFIADTLLGNFDRHNGNWGFLINNSTKEAFIAPIYDCASCLYPKLDDEAIKTIINDEEEMKKRVLIFPNSALKINNEKINYNEFISSLENNDCNKALLKIYPKIDFNKINSIIDDTPYISNIRKDFYKRIIKLRYDILLTPNYNKLI